MFQKTLFSLIFSFTALISNAQKLTEEVSTKKIIETLGTYNFNYPSEQLFVHFDKPYYSVGDTIWFKAYLLQNSSLNYSSLSGLLYLELITDSNKVVKFLSIPVSYGIGWGQIDLNKEEIKEGNYSIRAYTNWMQNFGEEVFFRQQFRITDAGLNNWLINENHKITVEGNKENLAIDLQLKAINAGVIKNKKVDFKVISGSKIVFKKEVETNSDGLIKEQFVLPSNKNISNKLSILLQDKSDRSISTSFPLRLNHADNIDLQFMPEGGYLVEGISSRVGFKSITENGLGIDIKGKIIDSKNNEITSFQSLHNGMGVFEIKPANNENYFAVVNFPQGILKRYPLPVVKTTGIVVRIDNTKQSDSIKFTIVGSADISDDKSYHFIGLSAGNIYSYADFNFKSSIKKTGTMAKSLFPSGIVHFTLMDHTGQSLNERIFFINHYDQLQIEAETLNKIFTTRDSIPFSLKVTDIDGKDVIGSFSVAVTDDTQIEQDSLNTENIISRMLLTGELKGNVESPGYYFSSNDLNIQQSLDALLLTQGWIGYDWKKIYHPTVPVFAPEMNFAVSGSVLNLFNKPVNKAQVILISTGNLIHFKDTLTNEKGQFMFSNFPPFDSEAFIVQARNARGKNFGISLNVNQFQPAEVKHLLPINLPWYVNTDTMMTHYVQNTLTQKLNFEKKFKLLPTVKISAKPKIKGSHNLNQDGSDQVINEFELQRVGKISLLQLLQQKVKGFRVVYLAGATQAYKINFDDVKFIIDGLNLDFFGFVKETLEYLNATDITGIEVMTSLRYTSSYEIQYLPIETRMSLSSNRTSFIEVTTRSGNGIFMKHVPGVLVYRPIPLTIPKQFYSPAYSIKSATEKTIDLRSTIYWNPNVVTNVHGEAKFSFFSADTPGSYTIIIQGSDLAGNIGYKFKKITIK